MDLEVRKLQGNTTLDVKHFGADTTQIVIGEDEKADFFLPADLLTTCSYPIARIKNGQVQISYNNNAQVILQLADSRNLSGLVCRHVCTWRSCVIQGSRCPVSEQ